MFFFPENIFSHSENYSQNCNPNNRLYIEIGTKKNIIITVIALLFLFVYLFIIIKYLHMNS